MAGDMTADGANQYAYDDEGRVCAVQGPPAAPGWPPTMVQYIYDAEDQRVAKGTIHTVLVNGQPTLSCDTTQNGFTLTNSYGLDLAGEQVTETGGDGQWLHTNVFVGGQLLATYDPNGLHSNITDWLGTRRVQTNIRGEVEETYQNLPFGELVPQNNTFFLGATEHHFTGKERDTESGNDYMFARYYNSATGRFLSPDWSAKVEPVPYAKLGNPQSLNLYAYVLNSPVSGFDPDGHFIGDHAFSDYFATEYRAAMNQVYQMQVSVAAAQAAQWGQAQQRINQTAKSMYLDRGQATTSKVNGYTELDVTYTAKLRDGEPIGVLNPVYITEHQTDKHLARGPDGMSGGVDKNYFPDDVEAPSYVTETSNQTFSISSHNGVNGIGKFGSGPSAPIRVRMNGQEGVGIKIIIGGGIQEQLIP